MAYNTCTAWICSGVPLDNTYTDVLRPDVIGNDLGVLKGFAKYTFSNLSYQRVNSSVAQPRTPLTMRVPTLADNLYDCNYVVFQPNAGAKTYGAFIRQVNYINPNNTEIVYEIDAFSTWFPSCTVKDSIIEREHTASDEMFEWLASEPLNVGTWTMDTGTGGYGNYFYSYDDLYWVILTTPHPLLVPFTEPANVFSGIPCGCRYAYGKLNDVSGLNNILTALQGLELIGAIDNVIACYISFSPPVEGTGSTNAPEPLGVVNYKSSYDGYTFKNNKLAIGQFRKIFLRSTSGEEVELKPELIEGNTLTCNIVHTNAASTPSLSCVPFYAGFNEGGPATGNAAGNWYYAVNFDSTIQVACTSSSFAEWLASKSLSNAFGAVGNAITSTATGAVMGGVKGAVAGGATSLVGSVFNQLSEGTSAFLGPGLVRGTQGGNNVVQYSTDRVGFECFSFIPVAEEAERIDNYFDMFGYATGRLGRPNYSARSTWYFIKTNDVVIDGSAPPQEIEKIKAAFNRGVRFWASANAVGNYSLENKPMGIKQEV